MIMRSLMLTASLITMCGCNGYRQVSLSEQVEVVRNTQTSDMQETRDVFNGKINEQNAIRLALSFNPDIRTPIIRERGWGDNEVQFRGVARPELDVDSESVTLGFGVDVFSLYNLLSPQERHAWREMRKSERSRATADQKGAVIRLTRDVKISFLELARLTKKKNIQQRELDFISTYRGIAGNKMEVSSDLIFTIATAEAKERLEKTSNELENARLVLIRLMGVEPKNSIEFDSSEVLNLTVMPEVRTISSMTEYAKKNNWQLISLYSTYVIKEYELRQSYLRRWGELSVGPSVTVSNADRETETTFGFSVRLRIPWPSHSSDDIKDQTDERTIAGARYTAVLHDLQSDITKQYVEMQQKWESIKNPKVSAEWMESVLSSQTEKLDVHTYLDMTTRIFNQEAHQLDEIAKYKLANIILDSLLK